MKWKRGRRQYWYITVRVDFSFRLWMRVGASGLIRCLGTFNYHVIIGLTHEQCAPNITEKSHSEATLFNWRHTFKTSSYKYIITCMYNPEVNLLCIRGSQIYALSIGQFCRLRSIPIQLYIMTTEQFWPERRAITVKKHRDRVQQ